MLSPAVDIALVCAIAVLTVAAVGTLGFRLSRSQRDLGSDAERATYATLHTASLASAHLRAGLTPAGAGRASRHLRDLLGCDTLVITDASAVLAWDGTVNDSPFRRERLLAAAALVLGSGRTRVFRGAALRALGLQDTGRELLISPLPVNGQTVGTVAIFAPEVRAGLVRAVNEVAAWLATQVELAELDASRAQLMEAEVRALRAQISPHFIYNSLNAIASYINTDPSRARELVVEFADFTRYSFRRHGNFTTIAQELESVDRYLLLERARFGERLKVALQIAPEVLGTVIPFLSLQPLVENSVRHGLETKDGQGRISIAAVDAGADAVITIEDNGVGMDPDYLRSVLAGHADGDHVGLRNVDVRLRQVYGENHGLVIDTAPGAGTLITMRVPKSQPENRPTNA
ncbi:MULTISPECIES: histidine kinase [unclassified Arthrobacter]|uniref:sensor histidine kinase n=1 Tax=unclassified Arthrobacter TaxID=235627 RepID=UPI001E4123DF|nr:MULTISPECIES: histidine kinase [unclassified Arthrobacter]MCC9146232.1 histidine kinase [Arthrobacter sp. zg-Y919]MDK1277462.1 histidine kinase [Arthrobacter sp. zg.Y919]MDM7990399.1 histidine kinase [Arthrobacter sp. zg-Y877]WIB03955.1 histidine kinase [Arthrobacter sp. zg-Y919]